MDIKPEIDPGFAFSLTFFHVAFNGRIETPVGSQVESLSNPLLQPFITRDPPLPVVEGYFNSPGFGYDAGGPDGTAAGPAAVKAILNNQLTNVASTVTSGLDFSAKQMFSTSAGDFGAIVAGTRLLKNDFQETEAVPVYSLLNTFSEPTAWKARGGVSYSERGLFTSLNVNYVNSYANDQFTPEQRIASWTTLDWYVAYKTGESPNAFASGWTVALSILNLTDRSPPYVAANPNNYISGYLPINFDAANASPVGRFISLQLSKRFGF